MNIGSRRPRAAVLAAVLVLHALLLWRWPGTVPALRQTTPPRVQVRLLAAMRPAPVAPPVEDTQPAPTAPRSRAPSRRAAPTAPRADMPPPIPAEPLAEPAAITLPAPTPAASAPLRLDDETIRRAIRDPGHERGLAARAGRVGPEAASPEQRLGEGIQQGARGDCLKGEYLGGGMGLLSLPFLAAAALREQCRR